MWNIASRCCVAIVNGECGHRNEILSVVSSAASLAPYVMLTNGAGVHRVPCHPMLFILFAVYLGLRFTATCPSMTFRSARSRSYGNATSWLQATWHPVQVVYTEAVVNFGIQDFNAINCNRFVSSGMDNAVKIWNLAGA